MGLPLQPPLEKTKNKWFTPFYKKINTQESLLAIFNLHAYKKKKVHVKDGFSLDTELML